MSSAVRMGQAGALLLLLPLAVQADPEVHHHHPDTQSIFSCATTKLVMELLMPPNCCTDPYWFDTY